MTQLFANNAASELASAVTLGAVSLTLKTGDGAKFPSPVGGDFFLVTLYQKVGQDEINHEIVKCTARAGDVLTVVRAQEGATARAFNVDDPVELRLTAGAMTANQDGIPVIPYEDRGTLRTNTTATRAIVDGLGLFVFEVGSTEPDDDESCFATATGRWLLQAAHWDLIDAWQLPEVEERDAYDEDEPLRFAASFAAKVITGSATCAITSVANISSASFTGTVAGAAVGDRVIATPPAQLGSTAAGTGRLSHHAWVSAANTVTVMLTNPSSSVANTNTAIRTAWPITVIKS